ncbi:putative transmembrane protein [Flavobacterium limnosediminis JC2902]|uniref:Putative transmembrane protein n=1 Tax=Flavobacterium limnosediminis JC2902 TaxID=1341181 RepID=V6SQN0_9FLAO|nr:YoaK family protein [Flavobacterium limnosediminis]ESU28951.1 putative transmembrane protein [Flavobacterium limnosediminis JC2902]
MFRHQGKNRTFRHNLRLASNLSLVAGIVNSVGVLTISTLTTNVTGHFAYFSKELIVGQYTKAIPHLLYIFFFFLGAFVSNSFIEIATINKKKYIHTAPMFLEIFLIVLVGFWNDWAFTATADANQIAYILLFSMGLQNALVTKISLSTVRTTHLTGLFTDLGIEISQYFFYRNHPNAIKLRKNIFLKLSIIIFFFAGCILGTLLFYQIGIKALLAAALLITIALTMDNLIFYYNFTRRKFRKKGTKNILNGFKKRTNE